MPRVLSSRRAFLASAGAAAIGAASRPASAAFSFSAARSISLYNTHSSEALRTTYWANGHFIKGAIKQVNWVLRDHRSNEVKETDLDLLDLLGQIQAKLETRDPFMVVCGYRSPATNAAKIAAGETGVAVNSFHIKAMAVDLRVERRSLSQLRDAALSCRRGGVGFYPHSDFVHVDTGPVREW